MNVFGTPLRVMDYGKGAHIWDVDGNEYLDFLAGIAVNALGYAHPKWVKAISEQAAESRPCEQLLRHGAADQTGVEAHRALQALPRDLMRISATPERKVTRRH